MRVSMVFLRFRNEKRHFPAVLDDKPGFQLVYRQVRDENRPYLPCTQPHSSAGDTTELLRISQKSRGGGNRRDSYFPRRPRRFSRLSDTAHTWLRCQPRESPSAGLRAGCIASHALSCAVRAAACVNTRGSSGFPSRLYSRRVMFVWYAVR